MLSNFSTANISLIIVADVVAEDVFELSSWQYTTGKNKKHSITRIKFFTG